MRNKSTRLRRSRWYRRRHPICYADNHLPEDRYKVKDGGNGWWLVMDMCPPEREVVRTREKGTAEWVAVAIDHFIHGEPGSVKRKACW
jgi:hypothetical protein